MSPPAALDASSAWRRAAPLAAGLLLVILLAYRETAIQMVGIWWRSDTFAHAFLVLPISLWLAWRRRAVLLAMTPAPDPRLLVPMLAVAALWLAADLMIVNAAAQFALVALLVLAVPAVFGLHIGKALMFPLLFLFFAVPFGEFMLEPMMNWTADFVVLALQLTGVPVYREGLQFVIPTGNWSVIDECSGVRYLIASFMVGSLFAYLNYQSYWRRAVFMLVSLIVPIVANWLRAYIIVMMGHLSGNKIAVGVDHLLYGWVFFGVVIFIMFSIGMRWSEPEPEALPASGGEASGAAGASPARPARSMAPVAVAAMAIVALPHLLGYALARQEQAAADPRLSLPAQFGDWGPGPANLAEGWKANYPSASLLARQVYVKGSDEVGVLVAYYRHQGTDRKLVSSVNGVLGINERNWNRVRTGRPQVSVDGRDVVFLEHEILGPEDRGVNRRRHLQVWQTYWVDGRFVPTDAKAKLVGAWQRVQGRGDDGAVVLIYTMAEDARGARAALERFTRSNLTRIDDLLQRTHDAR